MKTNKNSTPWIAVAALAVACFPLAASAAVQVKLAVNDDTSLYVTSNDSQCAGGPIDCIDVAKGSSPNLFFDLDNACKSGGPAYRLTQIRIAMASKDWPTSTNPLPQYVVDDFYADPNTGVIDLVGGDGGNNSLKDDRIKLKDNNQHTNPYTVFYEITAQQCNGTGEIFLDPSVKNGGK